MTYRAISIILTACGLLGLAGCVARTVESDAAALVPSMTTAKTEVETPEAAAEEQRAILSEAATIRKATFLSDSNKENALRVQAAPVTLQRVKVAKMASADAPASDALAQAAALLATAGAQLFVRQATVTTAAPASAGVYSEGADTTVQMVDSTITTTENKAYGIFVTDASKLEANQLTVTTAGDDSAVLYACDGGTLTVDGGTYTSGGMDAPAVYAAAGLTIRNAELIANNSEALVLDGASVVTLENCIISGNRNQGFPAYDGEIPQTVRIYQPTQLDEDRPAMQLTLLGGQLKGGSGDLFYITNTRCELLLHDVAIENKGDGALFRIASSDAASGWGEPGNNGARATITAQTQQLDGNILVDTRSKLALRLTEGSTLTGMVQVLQDGEPTPMEDTAAVFIDSDSRWVLTGDCTISTLYNQGEIAYNGYTITLADGTVLGAQ